MKKFLMPFFMAIMVMAIAGCADDNDNGGSTDTSGAAIDNSEFVDSLDYSILDGKTETEENINYYKNILKKLFANIRVEEVTIDAFGSQTQVTFDKTFLGNTDGQEIVVFPMTDFVKSFLPTEISGNDVTGFAGSWNDIKGEIFDNDQLTQNLTITENRNNFALFIYIQPNEIKEWITYRDKENKTDEETMAIFQKFASKIKIYKFNTNK